MTGADRRRWSRWLVAATLFTATLLTAAICVSLFLSPRRGDESPPSLSLDRQIDPDRMREMVALAGGEFLRGASRSDGDAAPARLVRLDPFELDRVEVRNSHFARFVEATGFITTAEQLGFGHVFDKKQGCQVRVKGAFWRQPQGPESSILGRDELPVVQVSWSDASAYAAWRNKRLPTEAEFEYAARGGLNDADFPWGRSERIKGRYQANYWQGRFPFHNEQLDGHARTAAVGLFSPNRFGLHDLAGNAREWCADWYAADYYQVAAEDNPRGPRAGRHRVVRGGSWMSPIHGDTGLRVWRRAHLPPEWTDDQTGFRCARTESP